MQQSSKPNTEREFMKFMTTSYGEREKEKMLDYICSWQCKNCYILVAIYECCVAINFWSFIVLYVRTTIEIDIN